MGPKIYCAPSAVAGGVSHGSRVTGHRSRVTAMASTVSLLVMLHMRGTGQRRCTSRSHAGSWEAAGREPQAQRDERPWRLDRATNQTMTDTVITSIAELTDFVRSTHVECTDDGTVHVVSVVDGSLSSRGHPSLRSPLAVSTVVALFNHTYETELSGSVEAESDRWLQLFRIAVLSV
eukprot:gene22443-28579_t